MNGTIGTLINLLVKIENSKTKNEFYTNNSEISANKRYDIRIVAKKYAEFIYSNVNLNIELYNLYEMS